jgi:hypothetical protein
VDFDESENDFYHALEEGTRTMFEKYVKRGWKAGAYTRSHFSST